MRCLSHFRFWTWLLGLLTVRNQLSFMSYCSSVQCGDEVEKDANSWPVWPCQVLTRPVESAVITTSRFSSHTTSVKGLCTGLHHRSCPWGISEEWFAKRFAHCSRREVGVDGWMEVRSKITQVIVSKFVWLFWVWIPWQFSVLKLTRKRKKKRLCRPDH